MSWGRPYLPRDWDRRRKRILRRDQGICYICGALGADEVDHVIPVSQGGGDEDENLAAIHGTCHAKKTQAEAKAANPRAVPRKRGEEKHPGRLEGGGLPPFGGPAGRGA